MVEKLEALRVGDPMDRDTDVGPLVAPDGRARRSTSRCATRSRPALACSPAASRSTGRATTTRRPSLTDIPEGSPGHREELFGPVALLWRARDVDDAIRIANDSTFGLGGSAWTRDRAEQERFVTEVETGMMYINKFTESTPEVPFGGVKNSGYGRELAAFGPRSFVNAKTVWIAGAEQDGDAVE